MYARKESKNAIYGYFLFSPRPIILLFVIVNIVCIQYPYTLIRAIKLLVIVRNLPLPRSQDWQSTYIVLCTGDKVDSKSIFTWNPRQCEVLSGYLTWELLCRLFISSTISSLLTCRGVNWHAKFNVCTSKYRYQILGLRRWFSSDF